MDWRPSILHHFAETLLSEIHGNNSEVDREMGRQMQAYTEKPLQLYGPLEYKLAKTHWNWIVIFYDRSDVKYELERISARKESQISRIHKISADDFAMLWKNSASDEFIALF